MEVLAFAIIILITIASLLAIDLLALRFGVDSRSSVGDDHARSRGF